MNEITLTRIFDKSETWRAHFFYMDRRDALLMEKIFNDPYLILNDKFRDTFMWLLCGIDKDASFAVPRRLSFEVLGDNHPYTESIERFIYFDNAGYMRVIPNVKAISSIKELSDSSLIRIYSSRYNFNYCRDAKDRSIDERVAYGRNFITQLFTYIETKGKTHIDIDFTKPDDISKQLDPLIGFKKKYIIFCEFPYDHDVEVYRLLADKALPDTIQHSLYFLDGDLFEHMQYDCQFLVKSPCIYRMTEPLLELCNK